MKKTAEDVATTMWFMLFLFVGLKIMKMANA